MLSTDNIKGTLNGSFTIGKKGSTIHQGTAVPSSALGTSGDLYLRRNGTASLTYIKQGTNWVPNLATTVNPSGGLVVGTSGLGLSPQADKTILSNITGGTAQPLPNTITNILDSTIGTAPGSIIVRNGSAWVALPPSSAGNYLETQGTSLPRWSPPTPPHPGFFTNRYYGPTINKNSLSTSNFLGNNYLYAVPIFIPGSTSVNRIGVECVSGNQSGALARIGIYDNLDGNPNNLLLDAGQVDCSSISLKEISISFTNAVTGWVWLAFIFNQQSLQFRSYQNADGDVILGKATPAGQTSSLVYRQVSFGALPSTFGTATINTQQLMAPFLWLRKV